jgi:translocation and assembly module TamB
MKKWLIIIGAILLALVLIVIAAWLWLTQTEGGARWAMARAAGSVERLEFAELSGSIASGVVLDNARFAQAGLRVEGARLELAARVELFNGPRIIVRHLRGRDVRVALPPGEAEPAPAPSVRFELSDLALPVDIDLRELDVEGLSIVGDGEPIVIERVQAAGFYGERIDIERLAIAAEPGRLSASGEWSLTGDARGRLALTATRQLADETGQRLRLDLDGTLDDLGFELAAEGPAALTGGGRITGLPGTPGLEVELAGEVSGWPGLPAAIEDFQARLNGRPSAWQASTQARLSGPDIPPGSWSIALSGDTRSLNVENLTAELLDGRVTGSGRLDWRRDAPAADARVSIESIDLTPLYPDWPNQGRVSGEVIAASRGGRIELERLTLRARPGELAVSGSGAIDPLEDRVDVSLQWQQFAWPPITDQREPLFASESGSLRIEGRISDWRARIEAAIDSPDTPAARIEARGSGSAERARIEQLDIDAGEHGSLSARGELAWAPDPEAAFELALDGFDPAVVVGQLPGRVDAAASVAIARGEVWSIDIDLERLGGKLRQQPIGGAGRVALRGRRPTAADLTVELGDNRVTIAGTDAESWRVRLEALSLGQLWPDIEGTANLEGRLRPDAAELEVTGQAGNLRFGDYNLEQAAITLGLDWRQNPRIDLDVDATNFDLRPWDRFERVRLELAGDCDGHRLELAADGARGRITLAAGGRLEACLEGPRRWRGEIERLELAETQAGDWGLSEPLPLTIAPGAIAAGGACLARATDAAGRLCLDDLSIGASGRVATRIEDVPMDLLLLPADPVFSLTTPLSGAIEAGWDAEGLARLDGHLALEAGVLQPLGAERELLTIDGVRIDFEPRDSRGVRLRLEAGLEADTRIAGEAVLADLREPMDARLEGEARLDLPDVAAFGHLLPRFDRVDGRLDGRVRIEGRLGDPVFGGRLALQDGAIVHAPLGLDIRQIDLEVTAADDRATLEGRAESGDGHLEIGGEARLAEQWTVAASIDGERFAFAQADWLALSASPTVRLDASPDRVRIDGDIGIDRLRAGLPPGSTDRIQPSPDVVVAGQAREDDAGTAPARRIDGRLGIDLGEDARLAAAGLETELAGGLELVWNGPPKPEGRGTIRLPEGSYQAYGQTLEISGGEIVFTGQPIDSPALDIRAVRDIFGDPEVDAAGVAITGSARKPDIELFTDPPTTQEKALAYVVTGADFDHAGGQGALNVGFYLLPKLFVSYGVGLFETGNVLSGRYELSSRWGVRVVSGERDTGVDLSYTLNN